VVELLVTPTQERVDAAVGVPRTAKVKALEAIALPPIVSVTEKAGVFTDGAVTRKLNDAPPFANTRAGTPLPDGP